LKAQRRKVKQHKTVAVGYNPPRPFYKKQIMQIVVKVDTGYGFGLGEGGLVGCSILAECFCPLLPNPCYKLAADY